MIVPAAAPAGQTERPTGAAGHRDRRGRRVKPRGGRRKMAFRSHPEWL